MEEKIMSFVCEALISSEKQINIHDKRYDEKHGGILGTHMKAIAEKVRKSLISHEIETNSFCTLMNSLICIIQRTEHKISNLLILFFGNLSFCFEKSYGKNENSNNSQSINRSSTKKMEVNEIIEIDDDDNVDYHYVVSDNEDIFSLTKTWTLILKQGLDKTKSTSVQGNNFISDKTYSYVCYGFIECLDHGLSMAGENSDILSLTNAIESLSISKNIEYTKNNMLFNNEGLPNPMIQFLATSFRAIVEAYRISH